MWLATVVGLVYPVPSMIYHRSLVGTLIQGRYSPAYLVFLISYMIGVAIWIGITFWVWGGTYHSNRIEKWLSFTDKKLWVVITGVISIWLAWFGFHTVLARGMMGTFSGIHAGTLLVALTLSITVLAQVVPSKIALDNMILLFVYIFFSAVLLEAMTRVYLYVTFNRTLSFVTINAMMTDFESPGWYAPNQTFIYREFSSEHKLLQETKVKTNNLGYVSRFDYYIQKYPETYRIAIIGDSLTASINSNITWIDELQVLLNEDNEFKQFHGVEQVEVLNFGFPGLSLHDFPQIYLVKRIAYFQPDLVIYNFITPDLFRPSMDYRSKTYDMINEAHGSNKYIRGGDTSWMYASEEVNGAQVQVVCSSYPHCLSNPDCVPWRAVVVPNNRDAFDVAYISELKNEILSRYLHATIFAIDRSYVWHAVRTRELSLNINERMFGPLYDFEEMDIIAQSVISFANMRSTHPKVLLIHNTSYNELLGDDILGSPIQAITNDRCKIQIPPILAKTENISKQNVGVEPIEFIYMDKYLPIDHDPKEIYRWFNLPHDGHWSDYGAVIYAQAYHTMLRKRDGL